MKILNINFEANFLEELVRIIRKVIKEELEIIQSSFSITNDEEKFYTIAETSEILRISVNQMYVLNQKRAITYSKPGNTCFYRKKDIIDYIESVTIKSRKTIECEAKNLKIKSHV